MQKIMVVEEYVSELSNLIYKGYVNDHPGLKGILLKKFDIVFKTFIDDVRKHVYIKYKQYITGKADNYEISGENLDLIWSRIFNIEFKPLMPLNKPIDIKTYDKYNDFNHLVCGEESDITLVAIYHNLNLHNIQNYKLN